MKRRRRYVLRGYSAPTLFISNLAAGISSTLLSEEEVLDAGKKAAPLFKQLVLNSIGRMGTV